MTTLPGRRKTSTDGSEIGPTAAQAPVAWPSKRTFSATKPAPVALAPVRAAAMRRLRHRCPAPTRRPRPRLAASARATFAGRPGTGGRRLARGLDGRLGGRARGRTAGRRCWPLRRRLRIVQKHRPDDQEESGERRGGEPIRARGRGRDGGGHRFLPLAGVLLSAASRCFSAFSTICRRRISCETARTPSSRACRPGRTRRSAGASPGGMRHEPRRATATGVPSTRVRPPSDTVRSTGRAPLGSERDRPARGTIAAPDTP